MNPIIISLTSLKSRYDSGLLTKTLNSLLHQKTSYKYIILLNISLEPSQIFSNDYFTTNDIENIKSDFPRIEVNLVKNYGPICKLIPTLKKYKNNIIITVDDDCEYSPQLIEIFVSLYKENKCIICSRARDNIFKQKLTISKYPFANVNTKSLYILPEGVGGILYHSSWFDNNFINYDFEKLDNKYKRNDDLLIKAYTFFKKIDILTTNLYYK